MLLAWSDMMIETSKEIIEKATKDYDPYAIVAAVSGGNDSRCLLGVCKVLEVKPDYVFHINTGTGIKQTTDYVRQLITGDLELPYREGSAGNAYETRVLREGFFGRGQKAHQYAYHILKAGPMRKLVSSVIRQRKRNRRVLILNGVRIDESTNRYKNYNKPFNIDPGAKSNIYVNLIHYWSKKERDEFLKDQKIKENPVSALLHRSGECMCGTMQSQDDRQDAAAFYPDWGKWINDLEARVTANGHCYKWGESAPKRKKPESVFTPMCANCKLAE